MSGEVTAIETQSLNIDVLAGDPVITVIEDSNNISIIQEESVVLNIVDVGIQGMPGAQGITGPKGDIGDPLTFELLTEQQKQELRGDVGSTSVNYTNLFYSSLLS